MSFCARFGNHLRTHSKQLEACSTFQTSPDRVSAPVKQLVSLMEATAVPPLIANISNQLQTTLRFGKIASVMAQSVQPGKFKTMALKAARKAAAQLVKADRYLQKAKTAAEEKAGFDLDVKKKWESKPWTCSADASQKATLSALPMGRECGNYLAFTGTEIKVVSER